MKKKLILLSTIALFLSGCTVANYEYKCGEKVVKDVKIIEERTRHSLINTAYELTLDDGSKAIYRGMDGWRVNGDGKLCVAERKDNN